MAECCYAECHYADCRKWCLYAECRYAECCYAECRGATYTTALSVTWGQFHKQFTCVTYNLSKISCTVIHFMLHCNVFKACQLILSLHKLREKNVYDIDTCCSQFHNKSRTLIHDTIVVINEHCHITSFIKNLGHFICPYVCMPHS